MRLAARGSVGVASLARAWARRHAAPAALLHHRPPPPPRRRHHHARWRSSVSAAGASGGAAADAPPSSSSSSFEVVAPIDVPKPTPARLDAYIATHAPPSEGGGGITRARVVASIKAGLVDVNGVVARKASERVSPGDVIRVALKPTPPTEAAPEDIPLDVKYEDEHVLVVNKPAGMVVHPAPGHSSGTLVNAVLFRCGCPAMRVASGNANTADGVARPGIVHRLDKGTSGLIVVAKNEAAHASLCEQFATRVVRRRYLAICLGSPEQGEGRVDAPIGRDPRDRLKMAVVRRSRGGRRAASNYKVRASLARGNASLVEWRLETGRTHQIRVHAREIGIPILGDETYGGAGNGAEERLRSKGAMTPAEAKRVAKISRRPMLHAQTLGFRHPRTGEEMDFKAEPPEDFAEVFEALRDASA
ncbi:uncharacterized protein MICPUCDRAFT_36187 [Micromonas pusilla CCMP1545]|uniref:Pseudouridine synthase n=1 Tax=Micromonas pusilla (strain CCMP1545) TaxID=564608 RepID=C1N564_MICPC|nr:uncharacterized protein MICPUCDRAFT_36187 [Micromonas pusilla CCMP1545]EEH53051.1 predicted protein [Micromonas pusilla CCMP1545]|eukprot:XP_003063112.1 predicted protein [Micromonas pusilla CCMP1545]